MLTPEAIQEVIDFLIPAMNRHNAIMLNDTDPSKMSDIEYMVHLARYNAQEWITTYASSVLDDKKKELENAASEPS